MAMAISLEEHKSLMGTKKNRLRMTRCQTVRVNRADRRLLAPQLSMPITLRRAVKGVRGSLFWTIQTSAAHINTPLPCSIHLFTRLQLLLRGSRLSQSAAPEVHCMAQGQRSKGMIRKTFSGKKKKGGLGHDRGVSETPSQVYISGKQDKEKTQEHGARCVSIKSVFQKWLQIWSRISFLMI